MRIAHCLLPASVHTPEWAGGPAEFASSPEMRFFDDLAQVQRYVEAGEAIQKDGWPMSLLQISRFDEATSGGETVDERSFPASCVRLQAFDVDDVVFPHTTSPRFEATSAMMSAARQFVFDRWIERSAERFPSRPLPTDLSGSCKFSSAFAQALFGGRLGVNERHQFLVLPGGLVLDLNADVRDVDAALDPYEDDLTMHVEPEWRDAMDSVAPRVDTWVQQFTASLRMVPRLQP